MLTSLGSIHAVIHPKIKITYLKQKTITNCLRIKIYTDYSLLPRHLFDYYVDIAHHPFKMHKTNIYIV